MKSFQPLLIASLPLLNGALAIRLSSERYEKVFTVLENISRYSWENGTKAQAILESRYPRYSVFSAEPHFPLPDSLSRGDISLVVDVADTTLRNREPESAISENDGLGLVPDAAAADPASLGVAVLLANASTDNAEVNGVGYGEAAVAQLNYLLYDVPRTSAGAISHRADQPQLWADFVYMAPPFLAYYGVLQNNQSLVEESVRQIQLYRETLRTDNGLWAHILLGNGTYDPGLWATGNAWAAAGMLRVLATIKWSQFSGAMTSQMNDLQSWAGEIIQASRQFATSGNMLPNYLNDNSSFEESSATALIAAAALRMSTLNLTNEYVPFGLDLLSAVSAKVNSTGYVTQVVNPYDFQKQGAESAEAQSFVIMAYSAYDEWDKMGRPGNDNGDNPLGDESGAGKVAGLGVVAVTALAGLLGWSLC